MTHQLKRIMLVEDDADIAVLSMMSLQDLSGFEVVHCSSGPEALERISEVAPDLLLLDYSMPGMNGGELLTALRSRPDTARTPAIFMTASVMPAHVQRLKELGALDVLAKPFNPVTLGDQLKALWDRHFNSSA